MKQFIALFTLTQLQVIVKTKHAKFNWEPIMCKLLQSPLHLFSKVVCNILYTSLLVQAHAGASESARALDQRHGR